MASHVNEPHDMTIPFLLVNSKKSPSFPYYVLHQGMMRDIVGVR